MSTFNSLFGIQAYSVSIASLWVPFNSLFGILEAKKSVNDLYKETFNSLFGIRAFALPASWQADKLSTPFSGFLRWLAYSTFSDDLKLSTPFSGF